MGRIFLFTKVPVNPTEIPEKCAHFGKHLTLVLLERRPLLSLQSVLQESVKIG